MALRDTLQEDMKAAMKARDRDRLGTIRMLLSEVKNAAIDKGRDLSEDEEISLLATQAKRRRESIESYEKGGRDDLAAKEQAELDVIEEYLPRPLTADEVRDLVLAAIAETGATGKKDMGKVMGRVMPQVRGRFPGKDVKPIVLEQLSD
ncbi:MAG: GatB/YqeY domain-containing protein [Myxococcota bacterium]